MRVLFFLLLPFLCSAQCDSSWLSNPSFDDYDCLPPLHTWMRCLTEWDQPTGGTSDFHHINGWHTYNITPQDGDGFVGFYSYDAYHGFPPYGDTLRYREYISQCLDSILLPGVYNYTFSITGQNVTDLVNPDGCDNIDFSPIDIQIYGSENCIPLGYYDCIMQRDTNVILLGTSVYDPDTTTNWSNIDITITVPYNIGQIYIGGACDLNDDYYSSSNCFPYFYMDNIRIQECEDNISCTIDTCINGQCVHLTDCCCVQSLNFMPRELFYRQTILRDYNRANVPRRHDRVFMEEVINYTINKYYEKSNFNTSP